MLKPIQPHGQVVAVMVNRDRTATLASERLESVCATYLGFEGEAHSGLTRTSCSRVKLQYDPGTEIRNARQISILSIEELEVMADNMEVPVIEPEWLGANMLLSGIPAFSLLPPSTRLIFSRGTSIVVDMENGPCKYPGEIIDLHYPGAGRRFPKAACHLRGITGWVEREGEIFPGDDVVAHIPAQPHYPHGNQSS